MTAAVTALNAMNITAPAGGGDTTGLALPT
jgi:hypothetical protein